jgi:hypothetical protein
MNKDLTKKLYPPKWDFEGIILPHIPSKEERENCGYKPEGYDCGKVKTGLIGGPNLLTICKECPYHPANILYK